MVVAGYAALLCMLPGFARADDAGGTWVSRVSGEGYVDHTYPADFHWDVTMTLSQSGGSVSGQSNNKCSRVVVNQAGWGSAQSEVGKTDQQTVTGTVAGSTVTLHIHGYTFPLTLNGNTLKGNGQYTDAGYTVNTWTFDLVKGQLAGIDVSWFGATAVGIGLLGALLAILQGAIPGPRLIRPIMGKGIQPLPPGPPHLQPVPSFGAYHQVPADALPQAPPGGYPANYPYAPGTHATMTCPRCGMPTLSPFTDGWFCTNLLCPARTSNTTSFVDKVWWHP
jgi:hypothetical protein